MAFLVFGTEDAAQVAAVRIAQNTGGDWPAPAEQDDGTWFLPQPEETAMGGVEGHRLSVFVRPVGVSTTLVPAEITNAQARAALMALPPVGAGPTLFDDIDAALRAGKDSADPQVRLAWQFWEQANVFTRHGALVTTMGASFGLGPEQMDQLFIAASTIEA